MNLFPRVYISQINSFGNIIRYQEDFKKIHLSSHSRNKITRNDFF